MLLAISNMYTDGNGNNDDEFINVRSVIPDSKYNSIFLERFERFNAMQSIIAKQVVNTNDNLVIAAPTGSGKTVIHELAILRFIITQQTKGEVGAKGQSKSKVLVVAPTKALCQQRVKDWQKFTKKFDLKVVEVTGDSSPADALKDLTHASIIITTPEKWDSLTRLWRQHIFLLGSISLLLLDEVHFVGESRGACLEAIVVRTRLITQLYQQRVIQAQQLQLAEGEEAEVKATKAGMRIVALSATLPNVGDVGEWLDCPAQGVHYFDETYRPVPLEIHTESFGNIGSSEFLFDKRLDERVPDVVKRYSDSRQCIVFCHSVLQTQTLASLMIERLGPQSQMPNEVTPISIKLCQSIADSRLRLLCKQGVAYHNSNVSAEDRGVVEQLFACGYLRLLCSTSTLSHGMNLPAYCVIIRGTRAWRGSGEGYCDVGRSDIIQMMGRAGRPGYDVKGIAVIMTDASSIDAFTSHNSDSLSATVAESHLVSGITQTVCAEIAQSVITDVDSALAWLGKCFFTIRVRRNPAHYNFEAADMDTQLRNLCVISLERLANEGIISYDRTSGVVSPKAEATVMSKHMINFATMVSLLALPPTCGIQPLLQQLSACLETQRPLRRDEKKVLNDYSKTMRYPMASRDRVKTPQDRTYVLLQLAASGVELPASHTSLNTDIPVLTETACRILTALIALALERSEGALLESAVKLRRSLTARVWHGGNSSVFLQISSLSSSLKHKLRQPSFAASSMKLGDVLGKSLDHIVRDFQCSHQDAERLSKFVQLCARTATKVSMNIVQRIGSEERDMIVVVSPVYPEQANTQARLGQAGAASQLICYDIPRGRLICYHALDAGVTSCKFTSLLPLDVSETDVRVVVISDCVGLDSAYSAKAEEIVPAPSAPKKQAKPHHATAKTSAGASSKRAPSKVTPTKSFGGVGWRSVQYQPQSQSQSRPGSQSQSQSQSNAGVPSEALLFENFVYKEPPLSQNACALYVPPPTQERKVQVEPSIDAEFLNSPVYQHYVTPSSSSSSPFPNVPQGAAISYVNNRKGPLRGPDLLHRKRHELQLSGAGNVKRLRLGDGLDAHAEVNADDWSTSYADPQCLDHSLANDYDKDSGSHYIGSSAGVGACARSRESSFFDKTRGENQPPVVYEGGNLQGYPTATAQSLLQLPQPLPLTQRDEAGLTSNFDEQFF